MASSREVFILGLIARRPRHGYEIKQFLTDAVVERWTDISTTHIYHMLRKLKSDGLIEAKVERFGNQPPRDVFSITLKGQEALAEMLSQDELLDQKVHFDFNVILATIGGLRHMPDAEKTRIVKRRIELLENHHQVRAEQDAQGTSGKFGDTPLVQALSRHDKKFRETELAWAYEVLREVEQIGWSAFAGRGLATAEDRNTLAGVTSVSDRSRREKDSRNGAATD